MSHNFIINGTERQELKLVQGFSCHYIYQGTNIKIILK